MKNSQKVNTTTTTTTTTNNNNNNNNKVEFVIPPLSADPRVKLKENEMKDKYFDNAREIKKLANMKLTFIPIVIGALGSVTEGLSKGQEDLEIRG